MPSKIVAPTPAVRTAELTPQQAAALTKFTDEAEKLWNRFMDITAALRAVVEFLARSGYEDCEPKAEDFVERLSPTAGMEQFVRSLIRDMVQSHERFDYAQMEFHEFLEALTGSSQKAQA
jgi:hypothetical protein